MAAIVIALEAIESAQAQIDATRAIARDRKRKERELARQSRDSHATVQGQNQQKVPPKEIPPKPPKEITPSQTSPSTPTGSHGSTSKDFSAFWLSYPRKVGKGAARKSFDRSIAKIDGPDPPGTLMAALARIKPTWTDPQFIPHPATWLNQERWEDGEAVQLQAQQQRTPKEQAEYDEKWRIYLERLAREQELAIG